MAVTNFGKLSSEQKTYWMREVWTFLRNEAFVSNLMGKDTNAAIQHITKLSKTEKGTRALMFLVADLTGRGVVNDNERTGNEESLQELEIDVNMGLVSNQTVNKGKLSDQNHVIQYRETARDRLKQWLVDSIDKMAFLTLSGISYQYNTDGSDAGAANPWTELSFASDVTAPSTGRHFRFDGTDLQAGSTAAVTTGHVPKYGMLVDLKAYAKTSHMKPIRKDGKEYFMYLCDPRTLAQLKKDTDFLSAITQAGKRGKENPFFSGSIVTVDGLVIMEHNLVYNCTGATSGTDMWGAANNVEGTRSLLLGCQALGMVDVGAPDWVEEGRDYNTRQGISIDKFIGFRKPYFDNPYTGNSDEDFGVICCDLAI